jgi:hypothetical protein
VRCERLNSLDHAARIRVLSRSYAVLISMAPLTGEALTITSSIPRHFGPIIPEVSRVGSSTSGTIRVILLIISILGYVSMVQIVYI